MDYKQLAATILEKLAAKRMWTRCCIARPVCVLP